jgi:hypothetical protein
MVAKKTKFLQFIEMQVLGEQGSKTIILLAMPSFRLRIRCIKKQAIISDWISKQWT